MRFARRLALGASVAALLVPALPAGAAEVTRDSYREEVEPVCKLNTEANERIFKGVRAQVRRGEYRTAARRFDRAAKALKGALAQLRAVPRPAEDVERLEKWFGEIEKEVALFEATASKLRAGQKLSAQRMVVRLVNQAERANSVVIPFQFRYCRLDPSRFT